MSKAPRSFAGQPQNLAVITLRPILRGELPVLYVSHDADDGGWQFLSGAIPDLADAAVVGLGQMLSLDPSLAELGDLPIGWTAIRANERAQWQRHPKSSDPGRP